MALLRQPKRMKMLVLLVAVALGGFLAGYSVYTIFAMNRPTSNSVSRSIAPTSTPRSIMELSPNSIGVTKNETFTIDITFDAQNNIINGADSVVTFDPQYLSVASIKTADKINPSDTSWLYFAKLDKEQGRVAITMFKKEVDTQPTTVHQVAQLTVKPIKSGTTTVTLEHFIGKTIGSTIIKASDSSNILDKVTGTTVTIL